jgi:hypothetical protein
MAVIHRYTMDHADTSGSTLLDKVIDAGAQNLTISAGGVTTGSAGIIREAYTFDGATGQLTSAAYVGPQTAGSISAWINPVALTTGVFVGAIDNTTSYDQFLISNTAGAGFLQHRVAQDSSINIGRRSADGSIVAGAWQHVVAVWDGGTANANIQLYINLIKADTADAGGGTFTAPSAASIVHTIGFQNAQAPGAFYNGVLDDVRIFDHALSSDERRAIYQEVYPYAITRRSRPAARSPRRGPRRGWRYIETRTNLVVANATLTQADATLAATAAVLVQPSAALTQADDTLAATAKATVGASATPTQADQTLSAVAKVTVGATAALSESQTLAATSSVAISATAALSESQTLSAAAAVAAKADAALSESQTLSATTGIIVGADAALSESQTLASTAQTLFGNNADAALTQADTTLAAAAGVSVQGTSLLAQDDFSLSATASSGHPITIDAALVQDDFLLSSDASIPSLEEITGKQGGWHGGARSRWWPRKPRKRDLEDELETLEGAVEAAAELSPEETESTEWFADRLAHARILLGEIEAATEKARTDKSRASYARMKERAKRVAQEVRRQEEEEEEMIALLLLHL